MSIKRLVITISATMLLCSAAFSTLVYLMYNNQESLLSSYENRYQSYLLADELRQSSDDLTRFARTYALTGDLRYEKYYFDILAIRNGKKPRPELYERIYWDLVADKDIRPRGNGKTEALKLRMKKAGFTTQELEKLRLAEKNSNALVHTETIAMNAVKGLYLDEQGVYSRQATPDWEMASRILHDSVYHHEKASIMQPVDEFFALIDQRTQASVDTLTNQGSQMFNLLTAMAVSLPLLSIVLAWALVRLVLKPLGGEPAVMNHIANSISKGELDLNFSEKDGGSGVYNSLRLMALNLKQNLQENQKREWLQEGMVTIGDALRKEQSLMVVAESLLTELSHYTDAQVSVFYYWQEGSEYSGEGTLERVASFGHLGDSARNASYRLGQGLGGQAAKEGKLVIIEQIPENYLDENHMIIGSAIGAVKPCNIALVPISYHGKLLGLIELGFLQPVSDVKRQLMENLRESIGITIQNVIGRGHLNQALMESRDLSEELQTQQEELRVTNETLQTKSQALEQQKIHLEVSQKEIEIKADQLEKTSQYKSEFLANMSHELRTPLNSLLILSQLLADNGDGNLTEEQVEFAQVIKESGSNLLILINDILDLSKVEAGQMLVNEDNINTQDLARNINMRFQHMAQDKGILFSIEIAHDVPQSFISDSVRLEQILNNLISNALKFTAEGAVSVYLKRESGSHRDSRLCFDVRDSGIGVAADKLEVIFHAFKQVDGSTSREFGGTGLGLSISQELAGLLGGSIEVESEPGSGSRFSLFIPERQVKIGKMDESPRFERVVDPGVRLAKPRKEARDDIEKLDASKPLFLIIEDDANFAGILYDCCHQHGYQAIIAYDGETGIELANQYQVAGIILDYMLPGIDGSQVLTQLKSSDVTAPIPVHIMSALDNLTNMKGCGAIGQSVKPVSRDQIADVLNQMLQYGGDKQVRMLVVEDDAAGSLILQKKLQIDNVKLDFVQTGEAALQELRSREYSTMVLDLGLPDMTGFEVLQTLVTEKNTTMPQVIVHTARDLSDDEYLELNQYTSSIVIKSINSIDRLLEQAQLFVNQTGNQQTPLVKEETAGAHLKGHKILLVDDDMRNTFALAKVLRSQDMKVQVAPGGQQALDILDQHPDTELVLMDIMMPGMNGYQAIGHIRNQPRFGKLPVIALTANAMKEDRKKCIDAGASDYLTKPVDLDQLKNTLVAWL